MLTPRTLTQKMNKSDCNQLINGIVLVNKAQGLSSNAVLQQVKRLFKAKKAGHTGSLDPLATGMLPVCLGEATKISQFLLDSDKCYLATGLLGSKTDTADALGKIIAVCESFSISTEQLQSTLDRFKGVIEQTPSMYSALKHNGQPLYKYARKGIDIARPPRTVTIHSLKLDHFDGLNFTITVSCSKGTYIRNLVEDIGESLGVYAHVTALHRLHTAGFEHDTMYTIDNLATMSPEQLNQCLIPMERAVNYLPELFLSDSDIVSLRQGKLLRYDAHDTPTQKLTRIFDSMGVFVGLGDIQEDGLLKARRLLAF